jgi:Na+-transporting methylmalonyl-CoA/oxaloacetate decarboxylase gamma subunit
VIYSIIEDLIAVTIHGVEFDIVVLMNVFIIAIVFTFISEITERLYKKEEPEIKEYEKKVEKVIKKEEDFLEDEEKIIERKIKGKK